MKIFRTPFALIALSCLCPLQAFGAGVPAKYVVGYATYTARIVPLWLAQEQGFFTKYGIDVDPVFIRGAPTLVAGMAAGSIHIGRTGGSAILAAVSAGHDFKNVSTFNSRTTYDLVVRPKLKRAEDLRGKTFAVTSIGGTSWMGILLCLNIWVWINSATTSACRSSAIRPYKFSASRTDSVTPPQLTVFLA